MSKRADTGTRDEHYNLISVLYHALQGAETYDRYIADAERAGDKELCAFFVECKEEEMMRAERAKLLLAERFDLDSVAEGKDGDQAADDDLDHAGEGAPI